MSNIQVLTIRKKTNITINILISTIKIKKLTNKRQFQNILAILYIIVTTTAHT